MSVLPAILPVLHSPLGSRHDLDAGDLPIGQREDGGRVSWPGAELREGNGGVPAGEDGDGGVLGGCPHEHGLVVHSDYLTRENLKQTVNSIRNSFNLVSALFSSMFVRSKPKIGCLSSIINR